MKENEKPEKERLNYFYSHTWLRVSLLSNEKRFELSKIKLYKGMDAKYITGFKLTS